MEAKLELNTARVGQSGLIRLHEPPRGFSKNPAMLDESSPDVNPPFHLGRVAKAVKIPKHDTCPHRGAAPTT